MKGMQHLETIRSRGLAPSLVMVDMDPAPLAFIRMAAPDPGSMRQVPQVFVSPDESIARLDLRALRGLRVFVFGHDGQRVQAFRDAALAHEAASVVSLNYTTGEMVETFPGVRDAAAA